MTQSRALAAALAVVLGSTMAGCGLLPGPGAPTSPSAPQPTPPTRGTASDQLALADRPPLLLPEDGGIIGDGESPLEKLVEAQTKLRQAREDNKELAVRLNAATQRCTGLEAQVAELERQAGELGDALAAKAKALAKAEAELKAANTLIAELSPDAATARSDIERAASLTRALEAARARIQDLENQRVRAELARVKAQQDLVTLQIVMARQQALLKRRRDTAREAVAKEVKP